MKKIVLLVSIFAILLFQIACSAEDENGTTIAMTHDTQYFYTLTPEQAKQELINLGFKNIELKPQSPNNSNCSDLIFSIKTKHNKNDSALDTSRDSWSAGDIYTSTETFTITYNNSPAITVENCEDLYKLTTSNEIDYREFAKKYDGRYIILKAHITTYLEYSGGLGRVIDVAEGPYIYEEPTFTSFRIDEAMYAQVEDSYIVGQNVLVKGKINDYYTDYYNSIVIDCFYLKPNLLI